MACGPVTVAVAEAIRWVVPFVVPFVVPARHVSGPQPLESMMRLEVETTIDAPIQQVWDVLIDWEAQREWMLDAKDVTVVTPQRAGHGVTIHVPTSLLGVPVLDIMRVTGWDPPHRLEATHLGRVVKGVGAFELAPQGDDRTHMKWWEEIVAPLGALGEFGANLALPLLRAIFARSLAQFKDVVEARVGISS